jgi:hypothetical protein
LLDFIFHRRKLAMVMNQVIREAGLGGLPKVVLQHKAGASAEIYLWGATLTSYKVENTRELLFVSKNALFDGKKGACVFVRVSAYVYTMCVHGRKWGWDQGVACLNRCEL